MNCSQTTTVTAAYETIPDTIFTPTDENGVTEEPEYTGLISGGVEAIPNQFPWVTRMMSARASDNDF